MGYSDTSSIKVTHEVTQPAEFTKDTRVLFQQVYDVQVGVDDGPTLQFYTNSTFTSIGDFEKGITTSTQPPGRAAVFTGYETDYRVWISLDSDTPSEGYAFAYWPQSAKSLVFEPSGFVITNGERDDSAIILFQGQYDVYNWYPVTKTVYHSVDYFIPYVRTAFVSQLLYVTPYNSLPKPTQCEFCNTSAPTSPDNDGDSIQNTADNCPEVSNWAQEDYDLDGKHF